MPDPRAAGERGVLEGEVPSPIDPPSGCRFHTRWPKLIAPEAYGLSDEQWDAIRSFVRAVDRREFTTVDGDEVRDRYFDGVSLRGEARDVVDDAIAHIERREWNRAERRLVSAFVEESICAGEQPEYETDTEYGDGRHFVACHLQREAGRTH